MPENTQQVTLEDVIAAGRVLFGPAFHADGQGWRADLKTTYKRRALETHPDRARSMGRSESDLAAEFRRVADAYRVLSQLAAGPIPAGAPAARRPPPRPARARPAAAPGRAERPQPSAAGSAQRGAPRASAAPKQEAAPQEPAPARDPGEAVPGHRVRYSVHPDQLPRRKLRFAEYLYYSGRVPWTALVEAISWQRSRRPAIGRVAVEWGFLEQEDVARILERRRVECATATPFGEFAVRLGYLTSFQLLAILGRQLRQQKRIGEFFVSRGYLEDGEIDEIRRRIARHNARWKE